MTDSADPAQNSDEPDDARWFEYLPSFDVGIDCEGRRHRLRWAAGELTAIDHDDEADQAFTALGGDPSPCSVAVTTWNEKHAPDSIAVWRLEGWGPEGPLLDAGDEELVDDEGNLPDRLRMLGSLAALARLVGEWRLWTTAEDLDHPAKQIARFQRERFHAAADASLESTRTGRRRQRIRLVHGLVFADETPELVAEIEPGRIELKAGLPLTWLVEVWGRGAAVVDDHLVLAVRKVDDDQLVAATLRWETVSRTLVAPTLRTVGLARTADGWQIIDPAPNVDHPKIWFSVTASRTPRR